MKEIKGNIFEIECDAICVTTNGIIKTNGELVMGAGLAKQFANRYPLLAYYLGQRVREQGNVPIVYINQTIDFETNPTAMFSVTKYVVSFPTKWDWQDPSDLILIDRSAEILVILANDYGWKKVVLTRPGCGLGQLTWAQVKPVLEPILDDRFFVITPGG